MAVRLWNDDGSELRVPTVTATDITDDTFTFAALVKPVANAAFEAFMSARDVTNDREAWAFGTNASNKPFYQVTQPGGSTQTTVMESATTLTDGQWYIVVFTSKPARQFSLYNLTTATWEHADGDLDGGIDEPASSAFISFGRDLEYDMDLRAKMALCAIWDVGLTNLQIQALAENLETGDWTNHEIQPAGLWSFTQDAATDDVADVMGVHDTITGSIASDTDTIGRTGTTVVTGEDPPGWDLSIPPPVLSFSLRLSGGASNDNPSLSIGGAVSTTVATDVFDSVSSSQAITGLVDYRLLYVLNNDEADGTVSAYVSSQLATSGHTIAIGAATEAAGTTVTPIATDKTAPAGVTFSAPESAELAVDCGAVAPGDMKGVWLRRTVPPGASEDPTNPWQITVEVAPL